jgi:hypothetical protein
MVNPTDPLALCPSYPQAEIREGFDTRNYREGDPRTLDVILRAGAVAGCVGIRRDVISGALRVPSQAARSIG